MIAIGRYLLLIISLSGFTFTIGNRFSEEDITRFLGYIFELHNGVRFKHDVQQLERTDEMDEIAYERLNVLAYYRRIYNDPYGVNYNSMYYDSNTQLNGAEAMKFFSLWYEQGNFYDYNREPNDINAGGFTQIVWENTKYIGLAFRCEENEYKVLAVYEPRGNQCSSFTENIKLPLSNRRAWNPEYNELYYQTETEMFLDNILILHNNVRREHGARPLRRDVELDQEASEIITMSSAIDRCPVMYGMNSNWMAYNNNTRLDFEEAERLFSEWYNKGQMYNNNLEPLSHNADPFTQIVWKGTTQIGMAIRRNNRVYKVLVLYEPRGNIPGQYAWNVGIPGNIDQGESSEDN